jgi:hypothetical protein
VNAEHYKKSSFAVAAIARMIIGMSEGERLATIQELSDSLNLSRGIIQNALKKLRDTRAATLETRGKNGTFVKAFDMPKLFDAADINFIFGSMPILYSLKMAGLATGISKAMERCPTPFNFAYIQGSGNRVTALLRKFCDFVVVSKTSALFHAAANPELEIVATLDGCVYANENVLYSRSPDVTEIKDGMSVAADPSSADQFILTQQLCAGKRVKLINCTYATCRALFLSGEVDCIIYRNEKEWIDCDGVWAHPLDVRDAQNYLAPAILASRGNIGIGPILRKYLASSEIARYQKSVLSGEIIPQYY